MPKLKITVRGFVVVAKRSKANSLHVGNAEGNDLNTHDAAANYRRNLPVLRRPADRHLLHPSNFATDRRGLSRRSGSRAFRDGSDRLWQRNRTLARADCLDTVISNAVLLRVDHHGYANLPGYLAGGPQVRLAWYRGVPWGCRDHRPTAGLSLRHEVPGVDGVRAGRCPDHRRRFGLYRYCGHRTRRDESRRRPLTCGSVTQRILIAKNGAPARPLGRAPILFPDVALPPDVRKVYDLPEDAPIETRGYAPHARRSLAESKD